VCCVAICTYPCNSNLAAVLLAEYWGLGGELEVLLLTAVNGLLTTTGLQQFFQGEHALRYWWW
jgi:hypothetical protein